MLCPPLLMFPNGEGEAGRFREIRNLPANLQGIRELTYSLYEEQTEQTLAGMNVSLNY